MHVAEFSVRRWQFTLVVFVALVALGASSLLGIPKAEDPSFPYPNFAVVAVLPGASPADVERLVVDPVEAELKALDDVKSIKTTVDDGVAAVQIEFTAGTDPGRKRDEVIREVTALRPRLPAELARLEVQEFNASRVNILQVALVSETAPYRDLDRLARDLKARLEAVPGVGKVELGGLPRQEVQVALDAGRMAALGVSPLEVLAAVGADAQAIPAGAVDAGARQLSVKTSGDYGSVEEIADTVVRSVDGRAVRVRDVAEVAQRDAEATHLVRFDGRRAVLVAANQKEKQDIFAVRKGLEQALDAFRPSLPPGVALRESFDQAANVEHRLSGFARDFAIAILLVLVTLLPLGLRAAGVVMVSIPLSLSVGLTLLNLLGFSVNQLSIVGFVIALGLLVDDSVVVVENVTRAMREGQPPRQAAVEATRQITLSVLGCTATLVFAFVPLLALPGAPGLFIRSMPVAVVVTILASLGVSLTVVPFLASRLLRAEGEHGNVFFRAMEWAIQASYRPVLHRALARPALTLGAAALLFAGALALVPVVGFSLFPKAGIPQFRVTAEAPEGASLAEADRAARAIEAALARHPEVRRVTTNVGRGNPMVYYNVAQQNEKAGYAEVLAELSTRDAGKTAEVLAALRAELSGYAGARVEVREFEQGPPVDAPVAVRVLADDPKALEAAAGRVEAILAGTEGTRYVRNPARDRKSDLRVRIDRDRAALLGVAVPDVDRAVRLAVGGLVAGSWREPGSDEARDIRLTLPRQGGGALPGGQRPGLDVLDRLYLPAAGGAVPLAQVATLALEPSPARVYHFDKTRSTTVTADVREGFNTDKITAAVLARLGAEAWPAGVRIVPAGEYESRQQSFGGLGSAIIVAALGVLAVLVLEFRTFRSTVIVASVIPLGIVGGVLALLLSGYTLSFTAAIGFVALMGIEVKNSILLVDFTNHLREQGVALDDAIQEAGEKRFVPILLTTLTAIGGLLPLALERSALYSPLALVILGGLVSSTLLTRVVTPVMYKLLPPELEAHEAAAAAPPVPAAEAA
ncbi:MAG TPA: efflux RND transporter permease subunit [Anaeromyxobacteraceae bacterium]|nr:efflux RND transporter permease subunit [Anaeromyxobacteraceae bacterium]